MKPKLFFLVVSAFFFLGAFFSKNFFFFHDEWTWLYKITVQPKSFIFEPHNEHFTPLFNLIYLTEYSFFGLNYQLFQIILLLFHFTNATLLYLIIKKITKDNNYASVSFLLFITNSLYWETIFASATFNSILCLFFINLSILFYLIFREKKRLSDLFFSGLFSLLSSYCWGVGLLFPFLMPVLSFLPSGKKKHISVDRIETFVFLIAGAVSIFTYWKFSRFSPPSSLNIWEMFVFFFSALKWLLVGFYSASPGKLKLFMLLIFVFWLIILPILSKNKSRTLLLQALRGKGGFLLFSAAVISYTYLLTAVTRYRLDQELAKSSRYTYIPVSFLIMVSMVLLKIFSPFFSKKVKLSFFVYFIFLILANLYFFRIYYQSWTRTISNPNKIIFEKIIKAKSEEELKIITFPSTFHSFFNSEQIYYIYIHSKKNYPL